MSEASLRKVTGAEAMYDSEAARLVIVAINARFLRLPETAQATR